MHTRKLVYKDLEIEHISKPRLKNSYISISADARIILKTPKVSEAFTNELLQSKENWIRKKLTEAQNNMAPALSLGDDILFFGSLYKLGEVQFEVLRKKITRLRTLSSTSLLRCYDEFYKESLWEYLSKRVPYFSQAMNLEYSEIKLRKMKSRWGSCSSKKVLTFNTELMKLKKELIDYVIVHELAHLKHMNHSSDFHQFVERCLPDSKRLRQELKQTRMATFH